MLKKSRWLLLKREENLKTEQRFVWAIDPTGKFILAEKLRTKLMSVPAPVKIALITRGKLTSAYSSLSDDGWALVRFRTGNAAPENLVRQKNSWVDSGSGNLPSE